MKLQRSTLAENVISDIFQYPSTTIMSHLHEEIQDLLGILAAHFTDDLLQLWTLRDRVGHGVSEVEAHL